MQHVHHSPSHVAEEIWIARKENRAHTKHHEHASDDYGQAAEHDDAMIELVFQGILRELSRQSRRLPDEALETSLGIFEIRPIGPDRPEIQIEGRVNDVK